MSNPSNIATARTVARKLRVPEKWIRDEAAAGRLPHIKAGSGYLFNIDAVIQCLSKRAATENFEGCHA